MIVTITILVILLIISLIMIDLESDQGDTSLFYIGTSITLFLAVMFCIYIYAYKEGQVDALSKKKIAYELVKQNDGSTEWLPKEDWND